MAKRVVARGSTATVLLVVILVGSYLINGWFASREWHPFIHKGGLYRSEPWLGQCSALGFDLWVPCWLAVAAPVILIAAALGLFFRNVD
jgi:hypothetical protein